jgi:hypothetical protein
MKFEIYSPNSYSRFKIIAITFKGSNSVISLSSWLRNCIIDKYRCTFSVQMFSLSIVILIHITPKDTAVLITLRYTERPNKPDHINTMLSFPKRQKPGKLYHLCDSMCLYHDSNHDARHARFRESFYVHKMALPSHSDCDYTITSLYRRAPEDRAPPALSYDCRDDTELLELLAEAMASPLPTEINQTPDDNNDTDGAQTHWVFVSNNNNNNPL